MTVTFSSSRIVGLLGWATLAGLPALGLADSPTESPASPHTITANAGVVSNYVFRGMTQTWNKPAIQGGVDYAHADGWYAGLWASSLSDKQYADGWAEVDLYGGFNGKFNADWSWTLGVIGYLYPSANYDGITPPGPNQTYNTVEANAGIGYKWISMKASVTLTDAYGYNEGTGYQSDTKGSSYWDLTANVPLPEEVFTKEVTLPLHVGRTHYTSDLASGRDPDYTDYKIGLSKTFDGGWNLGAAYTYADNRSVYDKYPSANDATDTADLGGGKVVFSLTKTF
ncbi:MAG: hypothetical protein HQL88_09030 [Magnetococcales bacterium]|nr:hypothetical protein [Magnetococcales bacterium]